MKIVKRTALTLLGAALLFSLPLLPAVSHAYCVYNLTNVQLQVCGGNCSGCMAKTIEPGQRACCPGSDKACQKASQFLLTVIYGHHWYNNVGCTGWKIDHRVEPHGWVTLSGTCPDTFKACESKGAKACDITYVIYDSEGHVTYQGRAAWNHGMGCN